MKRSQVALALDVSPGAHAALLRSTIFLPEPLPVPVPAPAPARRGLVAALVWQATYWTLMLAAAVAGWLAFNRAEGWFRP